MIVLYFSRESLIFRNKGSGSMPGRVSSDQTQLSYGASKVVLEEQRIGVLESQCAPTVVGIKSIPFIEKNALCTLKNCRSRPIQDLTQIGRLDNGNQFRKISIKISGCFDHLGVI